MFTAAVSAEFTNEWRYTSASPICLHGVDRDNFTLSLFFYFLTTYTVVSKGRGLVNADLLELDGALYPHNKVLLGLCSAESYFDDSQRCFANLVREVRTENTTLFVHREIRSGPVFFLFGDRLLSRKLLANASLL
jgi:hypothetical protein